MTPSPETHSGYLESERCRQLGWPAIAVVCLALLGACTGKTPVERVRQAMYDQPKLEPLEASSVFKDGRGSRPRVRGTVARGHLRTDDHFYLGKVGDRVADTFPFQVTHRVLERGQTRYGIYCAPCHDRAGTGAGMVVQRGFRKPPSFHTNRLREVEPGYVFDVITNGFGAMYSYGSRISPADRWAIVAYVRALQLSQHADLERVPEDVRSRLETQ